MTKTLKPVDVRVFDGYPEPIRKKMMRPRQFSSGQDSGDRGPELAGRDPEVGRAPLPLRLMRSILQITLPFRVKFPRLAFVGNPDTTPGIDDSQLEAR